MPELPEVERAAALIRKFSQDRIIHKVDATEDKIVYNGITHGQFVNSLTGRKVIDVGRYGKVFYIILDGEGLMPVLHLGMTGMILVRGQEPIHYVKKTHDHIQVWPPRFMKFILHIAATPTSPAAEIAFADARRLGRVRMCASPLTEPPISTLGFDPLLCMPSLSDFSASVRKRSCTIKALLLDQSFSAGVGNWVADEVLYQSCVHPEQRANSLSDTQRTLLHRNIEDICRKAVAVEADSSRFPENWLFKHRWGKGKKTTGTLRLPSGEAATIRWIKVGGRTSAYVPELQRLSKEGYANIPQEAVSSDGELTPPPPENSKTPSTPLKRKRRESSDDINLSTSGSPRRVKNFTPH